jgi:hypothetical protein
MLSQESKKMDLTKNADRGYDMNGRKTIAALFMDRDHAMQAISDLKNAGFPEDEIGVALRDRDADDTVLEDTGNLAGEGAASGAVSGGIVGGFIGVLIGIGALLIPGIGPVVAGGVLGAALAGAGIGAAGGGLVGALVGLGIPESEAAHLEGGFQSGGTIVTVNAFGRDPEAVEILRRNGAEFGPAVPVAAPIETSEGQASLH